MRQSGRSLSTPRAAKASKCAAYTAPDWPAASHGFLARRPGRLVANVMASVAEWEREVIGQRTAEALAAKRAQGVRLGRPRTMPRHVTERVLELRAQGLSLPRIARADYMRAKSARPGPNHLAPPSPRSSSLPAARTIEDYQTKIPPGLAGVPLPEIEQATGLSNPTCSRLRRGMQMPNPRHWQALARVAGIAQEASAGMEVNQAYG